MPLDVTLKIMRSRPEQPPHYETYNVTVPDVANVLDAIEQAWDKHDRDLMFRHACHHALWHVRGPHQRHRKIAMHCAGA